jgi:hypothetical protein
MEQNNDDQVRLPDLTPDEYSLLMLMLGYAAAAAGERGDLDKASMSDLAVKLMRRPRPR